MSIKEAKKFFRQLDTELETYINKNLITMTSGGNELHVRWSMPFDPKDWKFTAEIKGEEESKQIDLNNIENEEIGQICRAYIHSCAHRISERHRLWNNLYKSLEWGGRTFITTMGQENPVLLPEYIASNLVNCPTVRELEIELQSAGFVTCIDRRSMIYKIKTAEYVEWIRSRCFSSLVDLPDAEIERYISFLPSPELTYYSLTWIVIGLKLVLNNPSLRILRSPVHGLGLFSRHEIPKSTVIMEVPTAINNPYVNDNSQWHMSPKGKIVHPVRSSYAFLNHSDNPNCIIDWNVNLIISKRVIAAGEEMTLNYNQAPLPKDHPLA